MVEETVTNSVNRSLEFFKNSSFKGLKGKIRDWFNAVRFKVKSRTIIAPFDNCHIKAHGIVYFASMLEWRFPSSKIVVCIH